MKPYFYRAVFDRSLVDHMIRAGGNLEQTMRASVEAFGGKVVRCHLGAASVDPIGFLEFPEDIAARAWNAFYKMQPGVSDSRIERLLDEEDLQALAKQVQAAAPRAKAHRS